MGSVEYKCCWIGHKKDDWRREKESEGEGATEEIVDSTKITLY